MSSIISLNGPTGLGTKSVRIQRKRRDATAPQLHCPPAVRDDPALGDEVNERLIAWAGHVGIYPGQLERVRDTNFGRLLMLTHPDTDDPDRLLAAAKCALAEWATDDHYCDEGADPRLLGSRLGIAWGAVDPAHLAGGYAQRHEQAMQDDPVLVALRSALDHLQRYATAAQMARLRQELGGLFIGFAQEASWRHMGRLPAVWEYLAHRQHNSFLPCIALIDVLGGYDLAAEAYAQPRVRRAVTMAASAATLVNDLYSMVRERNSTGPEFNLPTVIAAEARCTLAEAIERSVRIHDELSGTFEAEAAMLALAGPPELGRFLSGVHAWLGGNREWHSGTPRYRETS